MPCIPALPMAALSTHCATGTGTAIFYVPLAWVIESSVRG